MRRSDFKKLAAMRLKDARALLRAQRYGASYYLAGYAVECALKACIAKQFRARTIPDRKLVESVYQHQLDDLVGVAGLRDTLNDERAADQDFEANWNLVKDWKPDRRYRTKATRQDAEDLYNAISDPANGVLQWLQRHW